MAERLTKFLREESFNNMQNVYSSKNNKQAINKLGKLEDIMEKYGFESVKELDQQLSQSEKWRDACELLKGEGIPVFEKLEIFGDLSKNNLYEYNPEKDCYEKFKYEERGGTVFCRRIERNGNKGSSRGIKTIQEVTKKAKLHKSTNGEA